MFSTRRAWNCTPAAAAWSPSAMKTLVEASSAALM
jgi:hypothetical protein